MLVSLSPRNVRFLRLRYRDGLTYIQIGEAMNVSLERVRQIARVSIRRAVMLALAQEPGGTNGEGD